MAEIDPQVVSLAREHFTFLEQCPQAEIVLQDARLALAAQAAVADPPQYDLIILDAYADDMMPIHLMTTEAIREYLSLLKPDGILAIHISSRYLELRPVIKGNAITNDLVVRYQDDRDPLEHAAPSVWTLLARNEQVFAGAAFEDTETLAEFDTLVWTDTYSALFPVVEWW